MPQSTEMMVISPDEAKTKESSTRTLSGPARAPISWHRVLGTLLVSLTVAIPVPGLSGELSGTQRNSSEYQIAIHCSRRVLQLWRHTELIREYPVEVGKGGLHKRRSGDHRTPIGDYEISWMASRHPGKGERIIDHRSWCRDNVLINAASGPPLEKLWTEPYGGDQAAIMSINYPNEKDRLRGYTGDCIHIHSDKRLQEGTLLPSYGCIHMVPADAIELYNIVYVGTPVKILP